MNTLGLSDGQIQVSALVEVGAAELLMATGFKERELIDHRTGWTRGIMIDAAASLGQDIFSLMHPSALNPDGIHQQYIEALKVEYRELDQEITESLTKLRWPLREQYDPLQHVTARLGNKATGAALNLWGNRFAMQSLASAQLC